MQKDIFDELMEWKKCTECEIGKTAYRHVLFDTIPRRKHKVDILFIGEGPGQSENTIGRPFVGRSGRLLRAAIRSANEDIELDIGIANLVACRPCDTISSGNRPPSDEEVKNCKDRLHLTIKLLEPKVIVALGNVPGRWVETFNKEWLLTYHKLYHPSFVLRNGGTGGVMYSKYVEDIKDILENVSKEKEKSADNRTSIPSLRVLESL